VLNAFRIYLRHFTGTQEDWSKIGIYVAEDYHKITVRNIRDAPYCRFVSDLKIHKLLQQYSNEVKDEYD
jgi:hypothetical protein